MINKQFSRIELILGTEAVNRLAECRVAVFGIGGVGGYAAEALARSGVGRLDLIDNDVVDISNLNRQIIALHSTLGRYKVDVMKERIADINPSAEVIAHRCFYMPETSNEFDFTQYDYIIDAVDTVTAKLSLAVEAKRAGVPIISSMGAGNKLHPELFELSDIYKTSVCPLAKVMRRELKRLGIDSLKVVYSKEVPITPTQGATDTQTPVRRATPGSTAFVPSVAGLILAGEVIRELAGLNEERRGNNVN